jgi:hypothetical protein
MNFESLGSRQRRSMYICRLSAVLAALDGAQVDNVCKQPGMPDSFGMAA